MLERKGGRWVSDSHHRETERWWNALDGSTRADICDAAVLGTGPYALAREIGGEGVHKKTLMRLIDEALQNGE